MSFAWVGDSVAYRLRDGRLDLVTEVGRKSSKSNALDTAIGYERNIERVVKRAWNQAVNFALNPRARASSSSHRNLSPADSMASTRAPSFPATLWSFLPSS